MLFFSRFISIVFHPINYPLVVTFLYFLLSPEHISDDNKQSIYIMVGLGAYVFPLIMFLLLRKFGMITSFHSASVEERKFPTTILVLMSLIIARFSFKLEETKFLAFFFFGFALALFFTYILLHFKQKISQHSISIISLISFMLCFSYHFQINVIIILIAAFVAKGFVIFSRLKLGEHNAYEICMGLLVGILTQLTSYGMAITYLKN
jgi:hypothetical protein